MSSATVLQSSLVRKVGNGSMHSDCLSGCNTIPCCQRSSGRILPSAPVRKMGNGGKHCDCVYGCDTIILLLDVISYACEVIASEKGGQWQQAPGLLQECDTTFFFLVDVISYSSAIVACEKGRKWKHAFGLLVGMQQHTLLSAVISYNSSINACEKGG